RALDRTRPVERAGTPSRLGHLGRRAASRHARWSDLARPRRRTRPARIGTGRPGTVGWGGGSGTVGWNWSGGPRRRPPANRPTGARTGQPVLAGVRAARPPFGRIRSARAVVLH